jgi:hypothetical protein
MRKTLLLILILFINTITRAQGFVPAHYYDLIWKKISGLIRFDASDDRILFKSDQNSKPEKVSIKDISAVVILNSDSLVVMTRDNNPHKRYFAKPYTQTATMSFFYRYESASFGGAPQLTTMSNVPSATSNAVHTVSRWSTSPVRSYSSTQIMYWDNNTTYELTKHNYIEVLTKAFADAPKLVKRLQSKEFKFYDVNKIFKAYDKEMLNSDFILDTTAHK